jgi:cytochrome b6-f complex iron-sulfur subunit
MERKDFLKKTFALCGLALIPVGMIESCSKSGSSQGPANVNFTLDLTNASNAPLNTVGGYLIANGVIVIRLSASSFNAFSATCTHSPCTVEYRVATTQIYCPCHAGTFDPITGEVTGGPPPAALARYVVSQSGNILTIKS